MSNKTPASVMLARACLHHLSRDLSDEVAKATANQLDRALRMGDALLFNKICSTLPEIVIHDDDPWRIKQRIQVISLIRFPLWDLDEDTIYHAQRERVMACHDSLTWSDIHNVLPVATQLIESILFDAFSDVRIADLTHGPGVVAETSDSLKKREVRFVSPRLREFSSLLPHTVFPILWSERPTRGMLVPKDHKTLRVIASEPCWTQWVQQAVGRSLCRSAVSHPTLRGHISFIDQEVQRALLKKGSVSTIDLSDASDTIRVRQLLRVVKDYSLREKLMALRTVCTSYKGNLYPTIGAFPMGAAVCFPFETIYFTSLLLAWCVCERGMPKTFGVFGDDIIVDQALAGGFCSFLRRMGHKPNMSKTFITGNFFETCGVYTYKGVDVTPVKIKKPAPVSPTDEKNLSYTSYAHESERRVYTYLSEYLGSLIKMPSGTRWNPDLQRQEYLSLGFKRKKRNTAFTYPEALISGTGQVSCGGISPSRDWLPVTR